jgi:hypothetical protein
MPECEFQWHLGTRHASGMTILFFPNPCVRLLLIQGFFYFALLCQRPAVLRPLLRQRPPETDSKQLITPLQ